MDLNRVGEIKQKQIHEKCLMNKEMAQGALHHKRTMYLQTKRRNNMPASLSFFFMVAMCVISCLRVPEGKSEALEDNVDSDEWAEQKLVSATGAHAEGTSGAEYGVVDLRTTATNKAASTVLNLGLRTDTRAQNRDLDVEDCAAVDADLEECAAVGARARRGKRRRSDGSNLLNQQSGVV